MPRKKKVAEFLPPVKVLSGQFPNIQLNEGMPWSVVLGILVDKHYEMALRVTDEAQGGEMSIDPVEFTPEYQDRAKTCREILLDLARRDPKRFNNKDPLYDGEPPDAESWVDDIIQELINDWAHTRSGHPGTMDWNRFVPLDQVPARPKIICEICKKEIDRSRQRYGRAHDGACQDRFDLVREHEQVKPSETMLPWPNRFGSFRSDLVKAITRIKFSIEVNRPGDASEKERVIRALEESLGSLATATAMLAHLTMEERMRYNAKLPDGCVTA